MDRDRSQNRARSGRGRPTISSFHNTRNIIPGEGTNASSVNSDGSRASLPRDEERPGLAPSPNTRPVGPLALRPNQTHQSDRSTSYHQRNFRRSTRLSTSLGHGSYNTIGMRPEWADWEKICLRVHGLLDTTTTYDLWSIFKSHGEVVSVELFKKRNGERQGNGRVIFSPPPTRHFWDNFMTVDIQGHSLKIRVDLQKEQTPQKIEASNGRSYPLSLSVAMEALQFGVLSRENEMMPLRTIQKDKRHGFSLIAELRPKRLEIAFACGIQDPRRKDPSIQHSSSIGRLEHTQEYKAQIPFANLKKIVFIDIDEGSWALLIPLLTPPAFYVKHDYAGSHSANKNTWNARDAWDRTVDITYDTSWFKNDPASLPRTNQFIDIGRWTTYRLVFSKSVLPDWEKMKTALRDFSINVDYTTSKELPTVPAQVSNFWDKLEPHKSGNSGSNSNLSLLANTEHIHLPYDVRYQLEVCVSQGFLNEVDITAEFLQRLADLSKGRTQRRDRAKDLLMYISQPRIGSRVEDREKLDEKRIYDPMSLFEDKKAMSHYPEISIPEHCLWVRKVMVTPTTMHLSSPAPEPSNRVLRQYAIYEDRFIRVQFTDELTRGRIFPAPGNSQDNAVFNRIHRTLQNGIRIGGRHFQYLASGNSQFRENGAYFFCPTDFLTCDNIRNWMGNVNHIRIVAKYAARLGQCFSTTRIPKSSPIGQTIVHIEDIEHNGWCFTDGVGKIAPSRAKFLVQNLHMNKVIKDIPSAFQFRLGGSKGILVQWPEVPFNDVHLRPSQNKFTSISKGLEIIKTSRFSVATLNRQTIIILSSLGVSDTVFEERMKKQVADYNAAMDDPQVAMRLLSKYVDQNGVTTTIAQMISDGFMETKEPFFMTILQVWRAWSMRLLREKARIVVDQSAFVFGCADETRTLRGYSESIEPSKKKDPDSLPQIFLQVPKAGIKPGEKSEYTVITGICMIGRNPSLHPGDIRVVQAVDVPALRHLRDVVVFPSVGDRDIPSMCSGGDLDGDDYFVVWDPELIPTEWNYPPMEQDVIQPKELKRDVKVTDLISFFVQYMKNDALSTIAHAHLAKCDALFDGPQDPQCIELARLHSNAVDYPKTGREAHLKPSLRPKIYPHFMEKKSKQTYHSNKILGRLYDQVAKVDFRPKLDGDFDPRILRRYAMKEETLKTIRMIKRQHDKGMKQIMNLHDIETEFEAWSTLTLSKPRVGSEYRRQETMEPVMTNHRERFREACVKLAGSRDPEVLYPVVAATYLVTWEEVQIAQKKREGGNRKQELTADEMPLISFPWIFEYELGRIAISKDEFELGEIPKATMALLGDDAGNDDDEFERLVGAGVVEGDSNDESHSFMELETSSTKTTQTTKATEDGSTTQEEIVELEEDEETSMDVLAKLGD